MDKALDLLLRYLSLSFLIFFSLSSFFINSISQIFLYISFYFLKLITTVELVAGELLVNGQYKFLIIEACIAPSAYVFIAMIFLTLPINFKDNIILTLKAFIAFSLVNLIRILILMWVHVTFGVEVFDKFHLIFYEGVSGVLTAFIIIYYLRKKHTKKTYPIYTDMKYLIKEIKH